MNELYKVRWSSRFKKDYKRAMRRGEDIAKLDETIQQLANGETLPATMPMLRTCERSALMVSTCFLRRVLYHFCARRRRTYTIGLSQICRDNLSRIFTRPL